ncbi:MAG: CotH kinase family protein [Candidatus Krumholzibacteria bacterium]
MRNEKLKSVRLVALGLVAFSMASVSPGAPARAQGWPAIFDPLQLLTLDLTMDPADWTAIQSDGTFLVEVPAMLSTGSETPILVTVRRKFGDPLTGTPAFTKVSLKIDVNELVAGQLWHDLSKISLENGDDTDVIAECFAWYCHRLASGSVGYGYEAGLASWVKLNINGIYTGVYVNPEQRNKRMLKSRNLWTVGTTWLYKNTSENETELIAGDIAGSPTHQSLCYFPFADAPTCLAPDAATLATQLPPLFNMQAMLTMAAVNAFVQDPDGLFPKGHNSYFVDFLSAAPRMYFPWDLDAVLVGGVGTFPVGSYADLLLAVPEFRTQYMEIMFQLLSGPLNQVDITGFLNAAETLLTTPLTADPNNQLGGVTVAQRFDVIRTWSAQRRGEVLGDLPVCLLFPSSLDFGTVSGSKDTTFAISNLGVEPLSGNVSESCGQFEIISGGGPFTLAPAGGNMQIQVRFTPTASGPQNCTIDLGTAFCNTVTVTGIGDVATGIGTINPPTFVLHQNHPNPFRQTTRIEFALRDEGPVALDVYDVLGKLVRRLVDGALPPGTYSEVWDGRDSHGNDVASGVYLYRLTTARQTFTRKAILLR